MIIIMKLFPKAILQKITNLLGKEYKEPLEKFQTQTHNNNVKWNYYMKLIDISDISEDIYIWNDFVLYLI